MRETRPLKQTANVLSGAFIKMSRTVDFRCVSERQGGDGVVSTGRKDSRKTHQLFFSNV